MMIIPGFIYKEQIVINGGARVPFEAYIFKMGAG